MMRFVEERLKLTNNINLHHLKSLLAGLGVDPVYQIQHFSDAIHSAPVESTTLTLNAVVAVYGGLE